MGQSERALQPHRITKHIKAAINIVALIDHPAKNHARWHGLSSGILE